MLKRLERLERRKPTGDFWRDPFPAAMRLWEDLQAVAAGKACWLPQPGPPLSPDAEHAVALAVREIGRMADRLRAGKPTPS